MIACRKARENVLRELDRELSLDAALELEAHLATCANCARFARNAQTVEEALVALAEPPVERLDIERNVAAIAQRLRQEPRKPSRSAGRLVAAAAVAAMFLGVIWWFARDRSVAHVASQLVETAPRTVTPSDESASERELDATTNETDVNALENDSRETDDQLALQPSTDAQPAEVDDEPLFDPARRAAAMEAMRECLREAKLLLANRSTREEALLFVRRVDELAREQGLQSWPLARLAEGCFDEHELAAAAMCYASLRGDRLSDLELERRAANDRNALLARFDDEDASSVAIAAACVDPRFQREALARLGKFARNDALHVLRAALRRPGIIARDRQPAFERLVGYGEYAIDVMLELDRAGMLQRDALKTALATIEGSHQILAFRANEARDDLAYWIDLCADVGATQAIPWLEKLVRESRSRELAIAGLSSMANVEAFDALLRMSQRGFVDAAMVDEALGVLALRHPTAPRAAAELALARGDAIEISRLLDLLITDSDPRCVPALLALAAHTTLAPEERELALDAVGELGERGDQQYVAELIAIFRKLGARERRIAASCAVAIEALGGRASLEVLLAGAPRRHLERVLDIFDRPASASVSRVQLARALEPVLDPRFAISSGGNP